MPIAPISRPVLVWTVRVISGEGELFAIRKVIAPMPVTWNHG